MSNAKNYHLDAREYDGWVTLMTNVLKFSCTQEVRDYQLVGTQDKCQALDEVKLVLSGGPLNYAEHVDKLLKRADAPGYDAATARAVLLMLAAMMIGIDR